MSSNEIVKQTAISTLKGAISAIPFVGGAINEYAFEARGRIKQERVNKFINEFADYLSQFMPVQLNIEQIEKEEFGDFFEEIIVTVSKTHSQIKRDAFRNLLTNQLLNPKEIDYAELLLSVIGSLQEKQIPILKTLNDSYSSSYIPYKGELIQKRTELKSIENRLENEYWKFDSAEDARYDPYVKKLQEESKTIEQEIKNLRLRVKEFEDPYVAKSYNIPSHEFYFLIQDLCNKGLLIDSGMTYGASPYELVEISQLGIDLIESIFK